MLPTIALVGRPNVGKSTLFNRLTRSRSALVADFPGLTRDRQYGQGRVGERAFVVIDTGGFEPVAKEGILKEMARQTLQALDEADIVIFLVDGRAGVTPQDARIADLLRRRGRAVYLAVNKTEGMNDARVTAEFYELGIGDPYAISAAHGDRVNALIELALEEKAPLPPVEESEEEDVFEDAPAPKAKATGKAAAQSARDSKAPKGGKASKAAKASKTPEAPPADEAGDDAEFDDALLEGEDEAPPPEFVPEPPKLIKIAVVGHPNVGKSTMVNSLLGEERVIAFDQPGTTRDSIYLDFTYKDREYTLIDTAGVRKRGKVTESIEKFSVIKTLQAIEDANVVVFMVDATEGVSDHDVQLASFIQDAGRALVVCLNKWDVADADMRKKVNEDCVRKLYFVDYAETLTISARTKLGLDKVMAAADRAHAAAFRKMPTPKLTRALQEAIVKQQPPRAGTIRPKMRYAHQGGSNPPIVVIHGTSLNRISDTYKRYLERFFLEYFELQGTPLRLELRTGHNPYADAGQSGRRKR